MTYLDFSATAPLLPEVREAMLNVMDLSVQGTLGNPSSLHTSGSIGRDILNRARTSVAQLINASPDELIFTSGGSESNNTVLHTFEHCPVLVSAVEHHSILNPAEAYGFPFLEIPVNRSGLIDLAWLEKQLTRLLTKHPYEKILVSVMLANNEVGTLEPITKLSALIKKLNQTSSAHIFLHSDATQAVGKTPVDVNALGVDYLTFTSHKLGGPVGIGALYVRSGAPFRPLIFGGAQESKRRAGTSNAVLAAGFAKAAEIAQTTPEKYKAIKTLRDYLASHLNIKHSNIITPLDSSLPHILNVSFPAAEGESTQLYLDLAGIEVSTGSACASGDIKPSHVLMAMFGDAEVAHNSVRFSLGLTTTKADIDHLLKTLPPIISHLQGVSTINLTSKDS
ncbi:cysteine desulfurase [Candidatus Saccharibacteria bacterium]|nr:cysteine desulfurase [Candidatus Saccharibacteria bacterium]